MTLVFPARRSSYRAPGPKAGRGSPASPGRSADNRRGPTRRSAPTAPAPPHPPAPQCPTKHPPQPPEPHGPRPPSRSEEHTSELQSLLRISYAVFSLKTKTTTNINRINYTL